jgi:hypothetical protein
VNPLLSPELSRASGSSQGRRSCARRPRWRWLAAGAGALLALAGWARASRLETLDGRVLAGEWQLTNGALVATSTNAAPQIVPLTNLLSVSFEEPGPPVAGTNNNGLGFLAYYFAGPLPQGPAYVRLDETIDFDWIAGDPAPSVSRERFNVTWAGEVEAPVSGPYQLFVLADAAVRLYVSNQLVLQAGAPRPFAESASPVLHWEAGQRYPVRLTYANSGPTTQIKLLWTGPGIAKTVVPRSVVHPAPPGPGHGAEIAGTQGLLGTYYSGPAWAGTTFTRIDPTVNFDWPEQDPAPGISRTNFSVRWNGRLRADFTEEYTFYSTSDEPVRLWLDNRLLLDRPEQAWLSELKESVPLLGGESYEIRLESRSTGGAAVARLFWSSASVSKTNIPPTHLLPARPPPRSSSPASTDDRMPAGVLLRNGSLFVGTVEQATQTSLRASGLLKARSISLVNVARILCQPLSPALAQRILPGRPGALLAKGDFVDGEFRGIEDGRVHLTSVLFGTRAFALQSEVLAIALHDPVRPPSGFEIRLRDRSTLLTPKVALDASGLSADVPGVGPVRLPAGELHQLKRF